MTLFKQRKLASDRKSTRYKVASPFEQDSTTHQLDNSLDGLTKGKEAIRCERLGLIEDKFVQSICKENQI